ncbi:MAG: T9SS C-terminal target domain-containing protein [Calditrichaeota bacterium]|nr:MAG: T9SS C-terminal target domain-containing protein [Calditrichota bacterium]
MKKSFTISDLAFTRKSFGKFVFSVVASGFLLGSGLTSSDAYADTFIIGTGTTVNGGTGYPTPFGNYYDSARTQYLYTAAELIGTSMNAGTTISQIGFYVTALNGMGTMGDFTVSMKNSTSSSLTSTFETGLSTVYGPVGETATAGDWHMITLDNPFIWDGSSNIVVETCFFSSYTNNASVQSTAAPGTTVYKNADGSSQCSALTGTTTTNRANIRFEGTLGVASSDDVGVTNIVVVGDPNDIGVSTDFQVTIKNFGTNPATGTVAIDVTNDGVDELFGNPFSNIPPDGTELVTFTNVSLPGTGGTFTCKATATLTSGSDGNNLNDTRTQTYNMIAPCVPVDLGDAGSDHTKFASSDPSLPAGFGATNITSTIDLSGLTGIVMDINVYVDIDHVYDGDVEISLESPNGTIIDLSSGNGSSGDDYSCTVFDDDTPAGGAITGGSPPFSNSFSPEVALSGFDGESITGNWILHVDDNYPSLDNGTLNEWGIFVSYGAPPSIDGEVVSVAVVEPAFTGLPMTVNIDVKNNSTDPISGTVNFDSDNDGTDESTGNAFTELASGATSTVVVTTNAPATAGTFTGRATIVLAGDGNASNDTETDSYAVIPANDVALNSVTGGGVYGESDLIDITVEYENKGASNATFDIAVDITNDGTPDALLTVNEIGPGVIGTLPFNGLANPGTPGSYTVSATVTQTNATDTNASNNTVTNTYSVIPGCITTFPYTQDFESTADFPNATGTGGGNPSPATGWLNGTVDFNWGYDSGTTGSGSTGPTVDNTLGNSSGRYAYVEASSPNFPSKFAHLYSPCFDISGLTNPSLSFFYHMFGQTMGDLHIDIVQEDLTTIAASVLTLTGQQQAATGDPWLESIVDLSAYIGNGQIRIRFVGSTGSDFYSDICIDDVMVQDLVGGSAPTITHTPISSNSEGNTATVTADINDVDGDLASGENAPTVWYRVNGGAFNSVSMTSAPSPSSQGIVDVKRVESKSKAQITSSKKYGNNQVFATFSADIPAQTGNDLVEYYIAAQDEASNVKTAPNGGSGLTPPGSTPPGSFYSYTVTPPPPANDDCANAIEITNWTTQITGNTAQATQDATDNQSCGGSSTHKSVWYKFTIPAGENWNVSFDLSGSSYDTAMELFSGTCGGGLTSIVCDDDGAGTTTQSRIPENSGTIGITAGNYYLLVSGYNSNSGDYTLQPTCNQILPPVNNGGAPLGNGSNPVNTNGGTTPVVDIILNGGANNPTSITVNTSAGTTPGGFQNGVSRTFNIQTTGGTNFTTDLKFYFLATEAAAGMSVGTTAKVWRKDGSTWVEVGSGTVVNEGGSPEWWSVTITGVSSTAPSSDKHVGNLSAVDGEFGIANDGDSPLFVELAYLNVKQEKQSAVLSWGTESEVDNIGFEIYRRDSDNSEFSLIASYRTHEVLKGAGNSSLPIDYSFVDDNVVVGKTYTYKLVDVDADLFETAHEVVSLTIDYSKATVIDRFVLRQNYPNPFNPETTISFEVPNVTSSMSRVEISIFNIKGQVVRNLVNQAYSGGLHSVVWDGKDNSGKSLASGVYFFKLRTNDNQLTRKMLLLK